MGHREEKYKVSLGREMLAGEKELSSCSLTYSNIQKRLPKLITLKYSTTNALLVDTESFDGNMPFIFRQPRRRDGRVGQEEKHHNSKYGSYQAGYEKNSLPRFKAVMAFLKSTAYAVCDGSPNNLREAIEAVPDASSRYLLSYSPPLRCDEYKP